MTLIWPGAADVAQVPLRRVIRPLQRPVPEFAEIVTAYTDGEVTLRSNRAKKSYHEAADLSGYQGVEPGDFVVHGLDILRGSVGVSDSRGAMSGVCTVATTSPNVDPRYLAYAIRLQAASGYTKALARGIRSGGADFRRWDTLAELPVPASPLDEQRTIANYLDDTTTRIDNLIAKQHEMIGLLVERRVAVISTAVVVNNGSLSADHGNDGRTSASLSQSWRLEPLRHLLAEKREVNALGQNANYLSLVAGRGVIPYVEKGDVGNKKPEDLGKCKVVSPGDFVINSMNYAIGSYGVSNYEGVCSPVYIVLRARPTGHPMFIHLLLSAESFQTAAQSYGNGILAHRSAIGWDTLKNLKVSVPPLEKQSAVAERVNRDVSKIDALIAKTREHIALAKERRSALITAAVTGQFDVRTATREVA